MLFFAAGWDGNALKNAKTVSIGFFIDPLCYVHV